ncbi:hypothetical protein [Clostridium sp. AM58-1XD]|uniref:hypothetical protein n=1 Tax=Clostridium sp. AM58-1XD TaxID=2292307 RepID=UPI000E52958D|nr:hypothetical protein [Clostridium sp. AM58-1XD]RGY97801.1 hypothetical protein DXA13_13065 [Clostridium sp. AM58-1XD]
MAMIKYMKELQNTPKGLEKCYQTALSLESAYYEFSDLAKNPYGNYDSFGKEKEELISKVTDLAKRLDSQIPYE